MSDFANPLTVVHQASLSFTISQSLLKFVSIESVMLSNCLILCGPLLLLPSIFPSISLFQWVSSSHQVAKVLELQPEHQSFQWIFRNGFLSFLASSQSLSLFYISIAPFCFQHFESSLRSLFWIIFQVVSLFPPILLGSVGFYHIASPSKYFPAFLFCLHCCIWGALSECWKFMVPLSCRVYSVWWGWTSGLSQFPGWGSLCLCYGG